MSQNDERKMKIYYANVDEWGIDLVELEVHEGTKCYIVEKRREILGIFFGTRIPKDTTTICKTLPEAIECIKDQTRTFIDKKQSQIAKVQEQQTKLLAAWELKQKSAAPSE